MSNILKFAKKLELKLAQSKKTSTTELFFGDDNTRDSFIHKLENSKKIKDFMKSNKVIFHLYAKANDTNASWDLKSTPTQFKQQLFSFINDEYKLLFNIDMDKRVQEINDLIKKGAARNWSSQNS